MEKTLAHYQVFEQIGHGGMGAVFRAHDTRLRRDIALKVLPPPLFADPSARSRLIREARAAAALNHPSICTIHEVGETNKEIYIAMELVSGSSLDRLIPKGGFDTETALRYGGQIADALAHAHEHGVIHRDLKSSNVIITLEGRAKVLDFGLARRSVVGGPNQTTTEADTTVTETGAIVGTPHAIAPEVLRGEHADARSDVWALGVLLHEMVSGDLPFSGQTAYELSAAILNESPSPLPPKVPGGVKAMIQRCLAKEPTRRFKNAGEVRASIETLQGLSPAGRLAGRSSAMLPFLPWAIAAGITVAAAIAAIRGHESRLLTSWSARLELSPPGGARFGGEPCDVAVSPDGKMLAFAVIDSTGRHLWLRSMNATEPRRIRDSNDAFLPFWSPDSRQIAFFSEGKLKRFAVSGEGPLSICDAPEGRGGTWGSRGVIVFAPMRGGPLMQVPAAGGTPTPATVFDTTRAELSHRFPVFLPDGKHFLFVSLAPGIRIQIGSIDSRRTQDLDVDATSALIYASGHVLFTTAGKVMAQRFNPARRKLTGRPVTLWAYMGPTSGLTGSPEISLSHTGILTQRYPLGYQVRLAWMDRSGSWGEALPVPPGPFSYPRASPDGTRLVVSRREGARSDLWVVVPERGSAGPLATGVDAGVWSTDGRWVAFAANHQEGRYLYRISSDGGEPQRLARLPRGWDIPISWSDSVMVIRSQHPERGEDLLIWRAARRDSIAIPWLATRWDEESGMLSPDGRWIAYVSDESGVGQIYLSPFPEGRPKQQLSTMGARENPFGSIHWVRKSRELLYESDFQEEMMAVQVDLERRQSSSPRTLFRIPRDCEDLVPMAGGKFLGLRNTTSESNAQVILNWLAAIQER